MDVGQASAPLRGLHRVGANQEVNGGGKINMVFTDPPWNVAIGLDSNPRHRQREGLKNDSMSSEDFYAFLQKFSSALIGFNRGDFYCVLGASEWGNLDRSLRSTGYHWSATIIWVKDIFVLGRSKYHRRYEPIWYGWHEKSKSSYNGARDLDDVWEIKRPRVSEEHPTMKPIKLCARAIQNSSMDEDTVFDGFAGGGSTMMACEQMNRNFAGIELDPQYVDVCCRRYRNATSIEPVRHDGKTFKELESKRYAKK